jgi:hypothetical protein
MEAEKTGVAVRSFATERAIFRHVFNYVLEEMALGGYDAEYGAHVQGLHDGLMWKLKEFDEDAETGKLPVVSDAECEATLEQVFGAGYVECIHCGRWTARSIEDYVQVPHTVIKCEFCGKDTPFETGRIENT